MSTSEAVVQGFVFADGDLIGRFSSSGSPLLSSVDSSSSKSCGRSTIKASTQMASRRFSLIEEDPSESLVIMPSVQVAAINLIMHIDLELTFLHL